MTKRTVTLAPVGKGRDRDLTKLVMALEAFAPDKPVNVRFGVAKPDRTPWQNRYLWGVAYAMLSEATGYEAQDVHEYACMHHFGEKSRKAPGGRIIWSPLRTTTTNEDGEPDLLDGDDFWRFVAFVQRLGAKAGIVIPDPDPDKRSCVRAAR